MSTNTRTRPASARAEATVITPHTPRFDGTRWLVTFLGLGAAVAIVAFASVVLFAANT